MRYWRVLRLISTSSTRPYFWTFWELSDNYLFVQSELERLCTKRGPIRMMLGKTYAVALKRLVGDFGNEIQLRFEGLLANLIQRSSDDVPLRWRVTEGLIWAEWIIAMRSINDTRDVSTAVWNAFDVMPGGIDSDLKPKVMLRQFVDGIDQSQRRTIATTAYGKVVRDPAGFTAEEQNWLLESLNSMVALLNDMRGELERLTDDSLDQAFLAREDAEKKQQLRDWLYFT
jgi:hypothetical protein